MKTTKYDPNFYRLPRNPEWLFVTILMFVFYLSLYRPDSVVLDYLGPLGRLARYLHHNNIKLLYQILYAAAAAHAGEAVYTIYVCRKKSLNILPTVLWTVQTFLFGFPSLLAITGYKGNNKQS